MLSEMSLSTLSNAVSVDLWSDTADKQIANLDKSPSKSMVKRLNIHVRSLNKL